VADQAPAPERGPPRRSAAWARRSCGTAADVGRAAYHAEKVELFRQLLPGVDRESAGQLLLTIVSLVNAWPVLGYLDGFLVGDHADPADRRRAAIVATATALARDALDRAVGSDDHERAAASAPLPDLD
jgi:hypothetical protein